MVVHLAGVMVSGIEPLDAKVKILVYEVAQGLADLLGVLQGTEYDPAVLRCENVARVLVSLFE